MYYNKVDRGDHFAACQEPTLFPEESVRASVASLEDNLRPAGHGPPGTGTEWLNPEPLGPAAQRSVAALPRNTRPYPSALVPDTGSG